MRFLYLAFIKNGINRVAVAPFGVFGAPLDAESRPGSPGDSGLARTSHKKATEINKQIQRKRAELIFYLSLIHI